MALLIHTSAPGLRTSSTIYTTVATMAAVLAAEEESWVGALFGRMLTSAGSTIEEILVENPENSAWLRGMQMGNDGYWLVEGRTVPGEALVKYLDQVTQANIKRAIQTSEHKLSDKEMEDIVWKEYVEQLNRDRKKKWDEDMKKESAEAKERYKDWQPKPPWGAPVPPGGGGFTIHVEPTEKQKEEIRRAAEDEENRRKAEEAAKWAREHGFSWNG